MVSLLVGCAGGSAKPTGLLRVDVPPIRPSVFLIYNFAVNPEDVIVDTGLTRGNETSTSERLAKGKAWANALSEALVMQLVKEGITSRRATGSTHIPLNAIVVKGQFFSIDEGSKLKRTTIGFGMGAEEVRAMVQVYQMRKAGLLHISEIEAEAHGRKTPGVVGPGGRGCGSGDGSGIGDQFSHECQERSFRWQHADYCGQPCEETCRACSELLQKAGLALSTPKVMAASGNLTTPRAPC